MDQGMYTAASGAIAMEERLSIISNNLANANTTGFKKDGMTFEKFSRMLDTETLYPGQYKNIPVGVMAGQYYIDMSEGSYQKTGNPLDVAIVGEGFFVVNTDNGQRYTRAGSFRMSTEGILTTQKGDIVQGEGGDIALGPGNIEIGSDGTVRLNGNVVDVLQIVHIQDDSLERSSNGLFRVKQGYAPQPLENRVLAQGNIEASNVDPVIEMVGLISTQRAYESFQKVIKSFNDTYGNSITDVGTVS
ncbi:MAG TPA: flagellar basal-body rod protein FlgF [Deltaproteobacteria bacterium]|nr:flagellar basal-body rod protein FlgF [Deltaproteobacteria bacterium]